MRKGDQKMEWKGARQEDGCQEREIEQKMRFSRKMVLRRKGSIGEGLGSRMRVIHSRRTRT